ncbi:MAG TPA: PAS domain-containing sensor histidine kinase [Actinomycetes bacterium]
MTTEMLLPALAVLALAVLAACRVSTLGPPPRRGRPDQDTATLQQIIRQSGDGIVLLAGDGTIRLWNRAMERLTGVAAARAVGRSYDDLLAGHDPAGEAVTLAAMLDAAGPDHPYASGEIALGGDGAQQRWLRCDHALDFEGGAWTTDVVIVHDLTGLHEAERAKADFVATVSHELRTPITPIKGYVELLRSKGDSMDAELRQEILRIVAERTDHMSRLIEDLLLASRISSEGQTPVVLGLSLERSDLVEVARAATADYLREPDCRLRLELPQEPLEVRADPLRLEQILGNLLSNAHKYSPSPLPVRLKLWRERGWAKASVVDRGRGIPRDELERIFDKFHRVEDPMTMTTSGTGLGLYIARELARAMGGEVEALSVPGRGSTFTLRLPLVRPVAAGVGQAAGSAPAPA